MKIDWFRLMGLASRLQAILAESDQAVSVPRGDTGLYLACRALAEQLERTNPGIYEYAGYREPIHALNAVRTRQATPGPLPDVWSSEFAD